MRTMTLFGFIARKRRDGRGGAREVMRPAALSILQLALAGGAAGQNPARLDLEAVRQLVARNEVLTSRLKLDFTAQLFRSGAQPESGEDAWRKPGRHYSHRLGTWAQDGVRQRWSSEYFFAPGEPAGGGVYVTDGKVMQQGRLPDLLQGAAGAAEHLDWTGAWPILFSLRLEQRGQPLSELLVPERAALADAMERVGGRGACVVTVMSLWPGVSARIWIDRERGLPLRIEHNEELPTDDQAATTMLIEVKEMHPLPNGGWIPAAGKRSLFFGPGEVTRISPAWHASAVAGTTEKSVAPGGFHSRRSPHPP